MKNLLTFSFIVIFFLTCCENDLLSADGNIITETRNPGTFNGIYTSGSNLNFKISDDVKY